MPRGGTHGTSSYTSGGDQNFHSNSVFAGKGLTPQQIHEQEQAALAIQSIVRGQSARQEVASRRESMKRDLARAPDLQRKPTMSIVDTAAAAKHAQRSMENSKYLVDPRKSKFIGYWDSVTGLALVFTAIVTPWEVAFAAPPTKFIESMFLFNRFIDSIFLADMVLQFMLIYHVPANGSEAARWEDNPRKIARHYLCTWFFLDLISILPFDILSIVVGEALAKLKIVRLFRLMRLIKLIRLIRASRMFKRWETRMAIDYRRALHSRSPNPNRNRNQADTLWTPSTGPRHTPSPAAPSATLP